MKDLNYAALSELASTVGKTIKEVSDEDHFLDLVNLVETHEKEVMMHKSYIGLGSPATLIASCHQLPMDSGSGFGKAVLGVIPSPVRELMLAKGSMVLVSSLSGDASWIVNVVFWPQVIAALQLDPTFALKPVTGNCLRGLVGDGGDQVLPSGL